MGEDEKRTALVVALLAGGLIGAGLGILFAPQSGKKTRRDVRRLGREAMERAEDFQETVKEGLDNMIEDISGVTREGLERGRKIAQERKEEVLRGIDKAVDFLEEQKGLLKKITR